MAFHSQALYRECSRYPYVGKVSIGEQDHVDFIYQFVKNRFIPEISSTNDDKNIDPSVYYTAGVITGIPTKFLNSPEISFEEEVEGEVEGEDISFFPWKYESLAKESYIRKYDEEFNYIDIEFHEAVYPIRVSLYQIFNPGSIFKIWAQDYTDNQWFLLWDGSIQFELYSTSRLFSPPLNPCYFKTKMLKLQFRSNVKYYYHSILDAVMIIGTSELILPKNSEKSINEMLKEINCKHQFQEMENTHNLTTNIENAHLDINIIQENFSEYCKSNVGKDFYESVKHEKVSGEEITCVIPFSHEQSALQASMQSLFYKKCWNIEKCSKYIELSSDKSEELPHCNLSVLPDEIILKIFKELDLKSLCRMNQVNKRFNNLTQDSHLCTRLNMRNVQTMSFANRIFSYFTPRCKYLKQLDLTSSTFAVKDFVKFLDKCGSSLTHLRLSNCDINNFALKKMSGICKNLKELDLWSCRCISNEGFSYLENLNNLECLILNGTPISTPVLCKILQSNLQMRELHLGENFEMKNLDAVAKELRNSCQKLDTINFFTVNITSDGIKALADCKNLRTIVLVNFEKNEHYESALCKLFSSCQYLEEIHLNITLTDNLILLTTQCKSLKLLILDNRYGRVNNYSIIFEQCPRLEKIHFKCCDITNRMINEWKKKYPSVSMYVLNENED